LKFFIRAHKFLSNNFRYQLWVYLRLCIYKCMCVHIYRSLKIWQIALSHIDKAKIPLSSIHYSFFYCIIKSSSISLFSIILLPLLQQQQEIYHEVLVDNRRPSRIVCLCERGGSQGGTFLHYSLAVEVKMKMMILRIFTSYPTESFRTDSPK
jgi:hypothetical protein